ncbi:protein NATD1 [Suricata suricatta]|uniref:protein NATD1 n=1 Tax=Suricata suricatta TaxID=37032 RepID=UPI0011553D38|nr:protein NATD1 [Suricata suricatta]
MEGLANYKMARGSPAKPWEEWEKAASFSPACKVGSGCVYGEGPSLGSAEEGEWPVLVSELRSKPWRRLTVPTESRCHDRAVLLYEYVGKRIVDLQHTEVPDAYRGRGIAKHLAKAALDFVVEEDLRAHLTCWYIQKYVKENPLPQYLERLQP